MLKTEFYENITVHELAALNASTGLTVEINNGEITGVSVEE